MAVSQLTLIINSHKVVSACLMVSLACNNLLPLFGSYKPVRGDHPHLGYRQLYLVYCYARVHAATGFILVLWFSCVAVP